MFKNKSVGIKNQRLVFRLDADFFGSKIDMKDLTDNRREKVIADHVFYGKESIYFVYPPVLPDIGRHTDGLKEITKEKLKELINRCQILKNHRDEELTIVPSITKRGSFDEWFLVSWIFYQFSEYIVIQKWVNYWLSVWYKVTKNPVPIRINNSLNRLDDWEIQKAKQNPIENHYEGRLRKVGSRLVGLCPFHKENTPSFYIYRENVFHCFGCSAHGDSISFIQKTKNLSFFEAVRFLL